VACEANDYNMSTNKIIESNSIGLDSIGLNHKIMGWREWIALPNLNIPIIKAKIDTGARTSSLHAFRVKTYSERGAPMVQFCIHPLQRRRDIVVESHAPVVDYRVVSDSGGHRERRLVIVTPLLVGGIELPIEITLANRESMVFRFLLGRTAISPFLLDSSKSFLLGRPTKKTSLFYLPPAKKVRKSHL
jgi:hypothetical protein